MIILTLPRDSLLYMDEEKIKVRVNDDSDLKKNYNFSDLAGKMKWKGNALSEQKGLRNEW